MDPPSLPRLERGSSCTESSLCCAAFPLPSPPWRRRPDRVALMDEQGDMTRADCERKKMPELMTETKALVLNSKVSSGHLERNDAYLFLR